MATESPNAPAWFKNRRPGLDAFYQNQADKKAGIRVGGGRAFDTTRSVPASGSGAGYGSGRAGAAARRFLRSSEGGARAVMNRWQDENQDAENSRRDDLIKRTWDREDTQRKEDRDIVKGQQQAEWDFINKGNILAPESSASEAVSPQTQSLVPPTQPPPTGAASLLQPAAPPGTRFDPASRSMLAPPLLSTVANVIPGSASATPAPVIPGGTPPIGGGTKIFSQYGTGNNITPPPLTPTPMVSASTLLGKRQKL